MKQTVHIILPDQTYDITLNIGAEISVESWTKKPTERPGLGSVMEATTSAVGLKPCGGCKKRKSQLNRATPKWLRRVANKLGRFLMQW
jgi:hypothetical protein